MDISNLLSVECGIGYFTLKTLLIEYLHDGLWRFAARLLWKIMVGGYYFYSLACADFRCRQEGTLTCAQWFKGATKKFQRWIDHLFEKVVDRDNAGGNVYLVLDALYASALSQRW